MDQPLKLDNLYEASAFLACWGEATPSFTAEAPTCFESPLFSQGAHPERIDGETIPVARPFPRKNADFWFEWGAPAEDKARASRKNSIASLENDGWLADFKVGSADVRLPETPHHHRPSPRPSPPTSYR